MPIENERVTVLLLFSSGQLGGAERSLSRMAMGGGNVTYRFATLGAEGPWSAWLRQCGVDPIVLGNSERGFAPFLYALGRLIAYLRDFPVDVIYVCGSRAAFLLRLLRRFPLSLDRFRLVHGIRWNPESNSRLDRFTRWSERVFRSGDDRWITNSKAARSTLVQRCGIDPHRISVIYNGIDSIPDNPLPIDQRPMEVVTVANLSPRKGHIPYLNVIRRVLQKLPNTRFVFVGRDDMAGQVQAAVRSEQMENSVICTGFQAEPARWLERARLFVLPSHWGEGCPTSILEAFANGTPAVAYSIDGIPELIENGANGFVVQPFDEDQMASRISELIENSEMAQRFGNSGRKRVIDSFSLASCVRQHDEFFLSMVGVGR